MGSRPPGAQHSNPLSSKGFPGENSTGRSLGQHFPGCLSPTPSASSSFSSSFPPTLTAPLKSSPRTPPRQQLRSYLWAASKGRELERSRYLLSCLSQIEARGLYACESDCSYMPAWSFHPGKKFLPLKRESMQRQCFSKYVPQTIKSRNALYQRLSLILNWFLDYKISQMCESPQRDVASSSILSFHRTVELLCWDATLQNKYSSEYTLGKTICG